MTNKIAVILDDKNELSSFEKGSGIFIYFKKDKSWVYGGEVYYKLNSSLSFTEIRKNVKNLALKLDECKIIVGKKISGLPFNVFDRLGFQVFEADNITDNLLDEIISDIEKNTENKPVSSQETPVSPYSIGPDGKYFLDLIELMQNHPEVSSKKAIKPFIETTPFFELNIICSHIPPWFEDYFKTKKLNCSVNELDNNRYSATITKCICS